MLIKHQAIITGALFFLAACADLQDKPSTQVALYTVNSVPVKHIYLGRGEATEVTFQALEEFQPEALQCSDKMIPFELKNKGEYHAYYSASYFSKEEKVNCNFINNNISYPVFSIHIHDVQYPEEALTVNNKRVTLSPADQKRASQERTLLSTIYEKKIKKSLFSEPFMLPLQSKITSKYGTKRLFNGTLQTQHLGTDFRAYTGTSILAANAGKVVFAGELFFAGNTIIIDHGMGVFTRYAHLSQRLVKVGDNLHRGDKIALSGKTGRVTAPHLHWDLVVHGNYVNGIKFVDTHL